MANTFHGKSRPSANQKKPPLGSGERFQELADKTGSGALAAYIGRKKFGDKKFAQLSKQGRKK